MVRLVVDQLRGGTRAFTFVVPILNRPFMRSNFDKKFREQMVQSHKRVIAET